jgi:hypothetical protein
METEHGSNVLYLVTMPIELKTRVDQSVIHLLPFLVFLINRLPKEMVISVCCESQRDGKISYVSL